MESVHKGSELGIVEIFRRERGFSEPRTFARRISAAEAIVKQIDLYGKLKGHSGCVNTIQFNSSGDLLVSGSDDQKIMFWNWATKTLEFLYPSGHLDNIFQVKIMPFTDDRKVVTSSADGQVNHVPGEANACAEELAKLVANQPKEFAAMDELMSIGSRAKEFVAMDELKSLQSWVQTFPWQIS